MTSTWCYILLALAAGATVPTQAGINARLNLFTHSPVLSAGISFAVGTGVLVLYAAALRIGLPPLATAAGHPWWIWSGGALGAFFVSAVIVLAVQLGATAMVALVLTGQLVTSILLDHYGLLGYPVHPANGWRIMGVVLLFAGAYLIKRF
ncbi:MAG: DMT family transporter [Desulfobacterales bacterium]|jgi:transporter family-2 protein|nr:DMT family transporter [Desulfobacteraceae bacterium]MDD3990818.1 DMT family transporter [Desulfobacteraceae bacterium]MDY0311239.1 DMT family transporter [Desulfobacterales bacterium]